MKRNSYTLSKKETNIMNRILKISLISAGGAVATALVSGISYFKGRKDGFMLAAKKYDGQLGVLCGLEAIGSLDDHGVTTRHPVTLAIFTNEEGARFQPAMIASGVMAGWPR
mgnify:CR=1 FL=1